MSKSNNRRKIGEAFKISIIISEETMRDMIKKWKGGDIVLNVTGGVLDEKVE